MSFYTVTRTLLVAILIAVSVLNAETVKIKVGTKIAEPFVIKGENGKWQGVSFALWDQIAEENGYEYTVAEYDLEGLQEALKNGEIDVAVSPLTITADRETEFDFSHPYYVTGLSVAARANEGGGMFAAIKRLISPEFMETVGLLTLLLFLVGLVTWLFERKKNAEEFGDGRTKGLGSSFWWAAVTMTTVGYGDKTPRTTGGRFVGLIWMFTGIIVISGFTAAIASSLTVTQLETKVNGVNDLYDVKTGSVGNSSSGLFLEQKRINYDKYVTPSDLTEALAIGDIDAAVYDAPILRYLVKSGNKSDRIKVLNINLKPQYYGFGLSSGSTYREEINRSLLESINSTEWADVKYKYFGE